MSKAILEFNLPEEQSEYYCTIHGADWKAIVYDLSMFLRDKLKYGHKYKNADETLEAMKEFLWTQCNESHLDPWED
jgi:hypothetical protein